ncbi:leucine-rich receptor-like protein kinase family protein [Striga asiatica]|uniref:non-specific serine/threonine protein kinase n=1 Tax=Striga asiatica TaxID=4170 RepID=A0A5A7PYU5_STRAF|nr:leucine-rich receptor-like protein kinase family protein [Striga asiatica]
MEIKFSFSLALHLCLLLINHNLHQTLSSPIFNLTTDRQALVAFRTAITFDPTETLTANWSATPISSPCNWAHISCGPRHQRVTSLNVSGLGLVGPISPHLGNLTFLRTLDMGFNNFTGPIPPELSKLRRLVTLNLASNRLVGPISRPIFNVSSFMKRIDMGGNMLTGGIPDDVCGNFPRLERLRLSENELEGRIPANISDCRRLEELKLARNNFIGEIPSGVWSLPRLRVLSLYENQLTGFSAREPGYVAQIEVLDVGENNLRGNLPSFIFNISSLVTLNLSSNSLSGSFPTEASYNLLALQQLYLDSNILTGRIPNQLGNLTSLSTLVLNSNSFSGELPQELCNLTNLQYFLAGYNNFLSGPIPPSLFNISTLTILSLQQNLLSGILPHDIIPPQSSLQQLILSLNRLSGPIPSSIVNASALTLLELNRNSFSGSVPNFGTLTNLRALRLWENNLTTTGELTFISSLTSCRNLQVLEISDNQLNGILPASVGNLSPSLTRFVASRCGIVGPIPPEFGRLENLETMALTGNRLTGSIPSEIGELSQLYTLAVGGNRLSGHIPIDICRLSRLGQLYLYDNELVGPVPNCLGELDSLTEIYFNSNDLNSTIPPGLWDIRDLGFLDLSRNSFDGQLSPRVGSLTALRTLDLSSNHLTGNIPSSIGDCRSLDYLSLANNNFGGPIPRSLGENLRGLTALDLSNNSLTGSIPESLQNIGDLREFNVSYNDLEGVIPDEGPFRNFTERSFSHNSAALCGLARFGVRPCRGGRNSKRSTVLTAIKRYVVPSFVVAAAIVSAVAVLLLRRRWKKKSRARRAQPAELELKAAYRRISYLELERSTNSFGEMNLLGRGGFGSVFQASLDDGSEVAVKVFDMQSEAGERSFDTESVILSTIRHRNLVPVIGCCANTEFKALILGYMSNGSLEKWLHSVGDGRFLDLEQRLSVAADVALALEYLHHGHTFPVVHCDVKPSNVLLDEDMTAHVSDFGISKLFDDGETMILTETLATVGYAAPEYGKEGKVSTSGDVYSYGILLLEMFTGKKPTDDTFSSEMSLHEWVNRALARENGPIEVLGPGLLSPDGPHFEARKKCVSSVFELAMKCTAESPDERINMVQAVAAVHNIRAELTKSTAETNNIRRLQLGV